MKNKSGKLKKNFGERRPRALQGLNQHFIFVVLSGPKGYTFF